MSLAWRRNRVWSWSASLAGSAAVLLLVNAASVQAQDAAQVAVPRGAREAAARQAPPQASSLPPTSATTMNAAQPGATSSYTATQQAAPMPTKLDLHYENGQLALNATNVSLNEILREIAIRTGLKITGGVTDQSVFGQYGPGSVGAVLSALLDGTGSNMLLVNASNGPSELILTARQGGPTPPSPMAGEPQPYNSYAERQGRGAFLGQRGDSSPVAPPPSYQPPPVEQPVEQPAAEPTAAAPTSEPNANGQSPNGVKTPLQIYQELQQLRGGAAAAPTLATPPAAPQ